MKINFPTFKEYIQLNENKLVDNLHDTIKNALYDSLVGIKLYKDYNLDTSEINKILEDTTLKIMNKIAKGF